MRRNIRNGEIRLKHLNASGRFKSGNVRYYYRPVGQKGIPMPDAPPESPEFLQAYLEAEKGNPTAKTKGNFRTGTIGAGITAYLASDKYLSLADSTRQMRRRALDDISQRYGSARLVDLQSRHIRQDLAPMQPNPANNRLKAWRDLARWWVDAGLIDHDPARDVRKRAVAASEGHKAWSRGDVATFRARWPHSAPQRLAFELMHRTCAAIGDACRLGPGMVEDGWLTYRRQKSGSMAVVPFAVDGPDWFEADHHLAECLKHWPLALTYIQTAQRRPRSAKAAGSWFSRACTVAGLPDLSAHGIRKHRAAVFRENGATEDQRMAILGHETAAEARNYSKSADLRRVISGTEVPTPLPTLRKDR